MPPFKANVEFHFTAESIEAAGAEIRRLAVAARAAGFELVEGRVEPIGLGPFRPHALLDVSR
jgi:hypothetical protein